MDEAALAKHRVSYNAKLKCIASNLLHLIPKSENMDVEVKSAFE